jgi:hypothetical protein
MAAWERVMYGLAVAARGKHHRDAGCSVQPIAASDPLRPSIPE